MVLRKLRNLVGYILLKAGFWTIVYWSKYLKKYITDFDFRSQELNRRTLNRVFQRQFDQFQRQHGEVLKANVQGKTGKKGKVLVFGSGFPEVQLEIGLMKALQAAGFSPFVLTHETQKFDLKCYALAEIPEVHFWSEYLGKSELHDAESVIKKITSTEDLLSFEYAGARVGRFAISSALRQLRQGSIDLSKPENRQAMVSHLERSMRYARASQKILKQVRPELALFVDGVYTPEGELVDNCLATGIDAILWASAHKSNSLILKRFSSQNRKEHPASLSEESWQLLREMEWTETHRKRIQRELYSTYASGDWYSTNGTQFNKLLLDANQLRQELKLDPTKKNAFIFPHILWDASLNSGKDLFKDYEDWFIETVRAACLNKNINWVIKIHPAHTGKNSVEGYRGETAEMVTLRKHIGELPSHISLLAVDSPINTFSLFQVMDYCVTVRGTIGIEAACFGIPVLTAGTGRYDRLGFTVNSESCQQFLHRLMHIQDIPRLTAEQRELAERFAYGLFVLRPFILKSMTMEYNDHENYIGKIRINVKKPEDWRNAKDLKAFTDWVINSKKFDFLTSIPETELV